MFRKFAIVVLAASGFGSAVLASDVNVRDAGAVGDGEHLETVAINSAIEKCNASGGGRVILPPGKYLTGTMRLLSSVTLEIQNGATVLASQRAEDYTQVENPWFDGKLMMAPLIYASGADRIGISGGGVIDGQGQSWWKPILEAKARRRGSNGANDGAPAAADAATTRPSERPQLVRLVNCR